MKATLTTRCHGRRIRSFTNSTTRWRRLERDVLFVGRLAEYRYYNMDQVVARALMVSRKSSPNIRRTKVGCRIQNPGERATRVPNARVNLYGGTRHEESLR